MANIKETMKGKKYPGQTARICDKRQMCCDEQHHFADEWLSVIHFLYQHFNLFYYMPAITGMLSSQS